MRTVNNIIEDVKQNGDKAVKRYTEIFDKTKIKNLEVNKIEIKEAYKKIDKKTLRIIKSAAANIKKFAKEQFNQFKNFEYTKDGITIGQRIIPIEKVGVYIPDKIINNCILLELKAKPFLAKEDIDQFWKYLKGSKYKLGFLINFGHGKLEVKRIVYDTARKSA